MEQLGAWEAEEALPSRGRSGSMVEQPSPAVGLIGVPKVYTSIVCDRESS